MSTARRLADRAAATNVVIVRLDRTIQYAAADLFPLMRRRLLDTRFRGYDRRAGYSGDGCRRLNIRTSRQFDAELTPRSRFALIRVCQLG
jgi:hypothetical protein